MPEQEEKLIIDKLKPSLETEAAELPPEMLELEATVRMMAAMLKEEEVEYMFGITAGAEWNMEFAFMRAGIKRVHVRHEQTAVFAAEAMGRIQGTKPGFALIGPSTGITNASTGVAQAYAAQSPTVIVTGEHGTIADWTYAGQGIVQTEYLFSKICKTVKRVTNHGGVLYHLKRAFRDALTPPTGPCAVAIPGDLSFAAPRVPLVTFYGAYTPTPATACRTTVVRTQADPQLIEKTIKWILEAEKPAMIVGEGVGYDDAEPELEEFVKLLGIPTHCRRISRGAISENDPLNCYGRARGKVMRGADRAIVLGQRVAYLENQGLPPFWGTATEHVQMQSCRENVHLQLINTAWEVIGSPKLMLRQMIDCAKSMGVTRPPEKWNKWRQFVVDTKADYEARALARQGAMMGKTPLHPDLAGRLAADFLREELNNEVITIIDGFTASSFFTDWQKVVHSRYNLDSSETIGIGHAYGMAIGGALATGCKIPLFAVVGDGSVGAGGMDIETCARWNIPAVFFHENNNALVTGGWDLFLSKVNTPTGNALLDSWSTLPKIRYDQMFKEFGCHTEFVERDEQVKPALKRAFDFVRRESKPAFVEVFVDPETLQEIWSVLSAVVGVDVEWDELPEKGKDVIKRLKLVDPNLYPILHPSWLPELMGE